MVVLSLRLPGSFLNMGFYKYGNKVLHYPRGRWAEAIFKYGFARPLRAHGRGRPDTRIGWIGPVGWVHWAGLVGPGWLGRVGWTGLVGPGWLDLLGWLI